ncbi:MAG: trigger factor [Rhodobacteraceae bacterium]|nr:trigger factor [Paracoccaceae bacterium]
MQVTETLNEGLKRAYSIKLTAAELDTKVTEKLHEAQPDVEMKGFRKGKVPLALLKRQFGQRIMGEAMQETIDGAMSKHFEDSGDRPAMQPNVEMKEGEKWKEGDDVEVSLTYEALPTIPEVDFSKIKLQKLVVKSDKAAVDEALDNLASSANDFKDRKKGSKAKDGDQIVIDFVGTVGGEAFDGGSSEDYPLVLGSNSFIPGFETQLVGCKVGEDKKVKVTFPQEYGSEDLAGKDAEFACKIKNVKEPVPAKINDELATKFGAEDLKALKVQISERLESEYGGAARAVMKRHLLDALDKKIKFELPPSLVEAEAKQIAHQLYHEENPDVKDHEHEDIKPSKEHNKLAERRVRLGLLLAELGQKAEVEVSDSEMSQAIMAQSRQYPGQEKEFFEFMQKNEQMQQQLRAPIFEDKVVDHIFEQATVTDKKVNKTELQTAVEALDKD